MDLTNEILLKIYGAYIGSKVMYKGKPTLYTGVKGNTPWSKQVCLEIAPNLWTYEYECKLLLRRLYDMSDVDAIAIAKIMCPIAFQSGNNNNKFWQVNTEVEGEKDAKGNFYPSFATVKINNPYNDYEFVIDAIKLGFNIYKDGELMTAAHDINSVGCINHLMANSYDCGHSLMPSLIGAGVAHEIK
jgi:hypothetical protein